MAEMRRESREVLAAMVFTRSEIHILMVGFRCKKIDFTTYWLSPGSRDSTFIFNVALNFLSIALITILLATLFFYNRGSWGIARTAASQDAV